MSGGACFYYEWSSILAAHFFIDWDDRAVFGSWLGENLLELSLNF